MRAFRALLREGAAIYFGSPLVYLVAAAFLAYTGYYFHSDLVYFLTFGFGMNIMENFWQLVFMDMRLVLIFSIPLLTMRLLAEERRLGTLELLVTYPRADRAIVAAKLGGVPRRRRRAARCAGTSYPALGLPRAAVRHWRRSSPGISGSLLLAAVCARTASSSRR